MFLSPSVILNAAPEPCLPQQSSKARSEEPRECFLCHAASGSSHETLLTSFILPSALKSCFSQILLVNIGALFCFRFPDFSDHPISRTQVLVVAVECEANHNS